jgi:hypothetical protein
MIPLFLENKLESYKYKTKDPTYLTLSFIASIL